MTLQRWINLWERLGAQGEAKTIYDDLVLRYSEPHRAYHTLKHINHCLDELAKVRHIAINDNAIELAIWYHDAIYNIDAKDNEESSARLAIEIVSNVSLPKSLGQSVANLIRATEHSIAHDNSDVQIMTDIDLSILGQDESVFDEYEHQVRREYERVPENIFVAGRSEILKSFVNRPKIYSTPFFFNKYEKQARRNIARSLARLRA